MNPLEKLRAARPAHLAGGPVDPHTREAELTHAFAQPREAEPTGALPQPQQTQPTQALAQPRQTAPTQALAHSRQAEPTPTQPLEAEPASASTQPRNAEPAPTSTHPPRAPQRRLVGGLGLMGGGRGRLAWGLGLAGTAAAAVTAVALVGGTVRDPAPTTVPSMTQPSAPVTLSAREVLLVAATGAERQAEDTGAYWHVHTRSRSLQPVDQGFVISIEQESESWVGTREQWGTGRTLAIKPATDADRAAWEKAGAPRELTFGGGKRIPVKESPEQPHTGHSQEREIFWLGRNVTMDDLRDLPSDPQQLKADLLRFYEGHDTESSRPMAEDAWLFRVTEGLILDMPVSPEVRAAAFRMLADLPSVTSLGQVTDAAGRTGTAIAISDTSQSKPGDTAKGKLRVSLIIDPATGRALARQSEVVVPGGMQEGLAPGTISNTVTVLEAGWTDEHP